MEHSGVRVRHFKGRVGNAFREKSSNEQAASHPALVDQHDGDEQVQQIKRKSWLNSPIPILYALVFGAVLSQLFKKGHLSSSRMTRNKDSGDNFQSKRSDNGLFILGWMEHILSHPVQPSDRYGFAEMGLRTRVYARLLESQSLAITDDFEAKLWPFAPGAKQMRLAHFGSEPPISAWKTSAREESQVKQFQSSMRISAAEQQAARFESRSNDDEGQEKMMVAQEPQIIDERGIVMSLGRSEVRFAMHFLEMLRNVHKSNLPVELYYYGDDDLPAYMREFLESSYKGVRTIDLEELKSFDPTLAKLSRQGWALKPFALLASNFSEVMLADADVVFLTRPEEFFEVEGYKKTGTLFFHDRDHFREGASNIIHQFLDEQLGNRGPSSILSQSSFWKGKGIYEQESGIVVADKRSRAVFSALFFAAWQNTGSIRERTTYRVFWGDKESYWLAFELSGIPYYFVDHYAGGLGNDPWEGQFCSDHPLHFLPEDSEDSITQDAMLISKDEGEEGQEASVKKNQKPRRPAWFNGSILENKGKSGTLFLNDTAWAVDSPWIFVEDLERWCLPNSSFSGKSLGDFSKDTLLTELIDAARAADKALLTLDSS